MYLTHRGRVHRALGRLRHEDRGYTLIELLVATGAGLIVTAAMGAIVVVSGHFGSNFADRTNANQEGRVAMEKIVQALNSSCVANGLAPIVSSGSTVSDGTHLYFYSALADSPTIAPNLVEVTLSGNGLWMDTYPNTNPSGSAPSATATDPWTFSSTPSITYTLLPYATAPDGGTAPVFQYYGYSSGGALSTTAYSTPLTAATAATTIEVVINFTALPADDWNTGGRATDLEDSVVLRLTPASSSSSATNAPCT